MPAAHSRPGNTIEKCRRTFPPLNYTVKRTVVLLKKRRDFEFFSAGIQAIPADIDRRAVAMAALQVAGGFAHDAARHCR
jgi:hypothetical protein